MIKICHIDIQPKTGIFRMMREAVAAKNNGYDVTIISEGKSGVEQGILFIGFLPAPSRINRFFKRSLEMVNKAISLNPDIIQLHAPELLLYANKIKKAGIKVIFDSHEFYSLQILMKKYIPKIFRNIISFIYSKYEAHICKKIDCVLYPCTINGKNYFEKISKKSYKIDNYSMIIDDIPVAPKQNAVIHAGGLTEERGITTLAEAILKTDAKLILCGPFSSKEYEEKIMTMLPIEKVEYMGNVDRTELFKQYSRCKIGICTLHACGQYSQLDNMSTKVYEYMQCGLPVIMSDFPCYKKWNNIYNFGICVNPNNSEEIANAINYLLANPEEAAKFGQNGRNAVEKEFNWDKESKKLLNIYKEL